jgi:hypothetical protein
MPLPLPSIALPSTTLPVAPVTTTGPGPPANKVFIFHRTHTARLYLVESSSTRRANIVRRHVSQPAHYPQAAVTKQDANAKKEKPNHRPSLLLGAQGIDRSAQDATRRPGGQENHHEKPNIRAPVSRPQSLPPSSIHRVPIPSPPHLKRARQRPITSPWHTSSALNSDPSSVR